MPQPERYARDIVKMGRKYPRLRVVTKEERVFFESHVREYSFARASPKNKNGGHCWSPFSGGV
jgi:hypothetical protein